MALVSVRTLDVSSPRCRSVLTVSREVSQARAKTTTKTFASTTAVTSAAPTTTATEAADTSTARTTTAETTEKV